MLRKGWLAHVIDEDRLVAFGLTDWANTALNVTLRTTGYQRNRRGAKPPDRHRRRCTLFSHSGARHQIKIDKAIDTRELCWCRVCLQTASDCEVSSERFLEFSRSESQFMRHDSVLLSILFHIFRVCKKYILLIYCNTIRILGCLGGVSWIGLFHYLKLICIYENKWSFEVFFS